MDGLREFIREQIVDYYTNVELKELEDFS